MQLRAISLAYIPEDYNKENLRWEYLMQKVIGIIGSLRAESFNRKLALKAQELASEFELELVTLEDIPLFSQDLEENPPQSVASLREKVRAADGVWFFTAEYNHSIPGVLKNAIDWLSRPSEQGPQVFINKPVALSGATPGMAGTSLAQDHLVVVLSFLNARIMNSSRLTIPRVGDLVDAQGNFDLGDSTKYLQRQIDAFAQFIK